MRTVRLAAAWLVAGAACVNGAPSTAIDAARDAALDAASVPHQRVLFIGNSYTGVNDLPAVVAALSTAPQSPVRFDVGSFTPGGETWAGHDANPDVTALIAQGWDTVVLQEQSQTPWISGFGEVPAALASLDGKIHAAGATTVLYMTWARHAEPATVFAQNLALARFYDGYGARIGATVAPVGRAWERALRDPGRVLHADDGSHPTLEGTYLAACVFYATLTGASALGLGDGGLAIDPGELPELQAIADQTIASRVAPAPPGLGAWTLSADGVGPDLVRSPELALGDTDGGTGFGPTRYAAVPYVTGIDPDTVTIAFHARRDSWAAPAGTTEDIVTLPENYRFAQSGTTLRAEVYVGMWQPMLTYAVDQLADGWHRFALTYDGTTYALWVDGVQASAATAPGQLGGFTAPLGLLLGAPEALATNPFIPVEPRTEFTGALADIALFDHALAQPEIQGL